MMILFKIYLVFKFVTELLLSKKFRKALAIIYKAILEWLRDEDFEAVDIALLLLSDLIIENNIANITIVHGVLQATKQHKNLLKNREDFIISTKKILSEKYSEKTLNALLEDVI